MTGTTLLDRFKRAFAKAGDDNVGLLAAGISYYAFLALVPLLASAVLVYGLVADAGTVARHIGALAENLPASAAELVGGQLEAVVESNSGKKGLGLLLALAIALFGARNGAGSVVIGLSIAYDAPQERSFLRSNALALLITAGAIVGAGLMVAATTVMAALEDLLPGLGVAGVILGKVLTYSVLLGAGIGGALVLFHLAPDHRDVPLRRDLPGAVFTGVGWVVLTFLFGLYVANFGSYNATYGSLGAVIVLLTWLYLTGYLLLLGGELNAVWSASPSVQSGTFEQVPSN